MNNKARRLSGRAAWGAVALAGWTAVALADVWDPRDNGINASQNELVHGSVQQHELGPGGAFVPLGRDQDFFRIGQRPFSSYEVLVDGTTTEISNTVELQRFQGGILMQNAVAVQLGQSRSLRWQNSVNSNVTNTSIRVGSSQPCVACTSAQNAYSIRTFETTYAIPRFNNSSTQITVLTIQNTAAYPVAATLHFFDAAGAALGSHLVAFTPKQLLVLNTSTLPFAMGVGGTILVTHDGRYGDLAGKAVALEPATGFAFDTLMSPRPL